MSPAPAPYTPAPHECENQKAFAAFEVEAISHVDDLYRVAMRMLREPSKASDAVQETYLLAWKSFKKYEAADFLKRELSTGIVESSGGHGP